MKHLDTARFRENVLSLGVLQAANYIIPLIVSVYLIKTLGPERFGLIAFSVALISYFSIVTDFGFNFSGVRLVSIARHDKAELRSIYRAIMCAKALLAAACFVFLLVPLFMVDRLAVDKDIYLLTFGIVIGQALLPTWLFQGLEELRYLSILNISGKVLGAIAILALVNGPADYLYVPAINSAAAIMIGLVALLRIRTKHDLALGLESARAIANHMRESWDYFLANLASSLYTITTITIVGIIGGNAQAGFFSAADKLIQAAKGVFYPFTQAMFPISARKLRADLADGIRFIARIGIPLTMVMTGISLGIFMFSEEIISILFGSDYAPSAGPLRIMAFVPPIVCASNLLGIQLMLNAGKQREFRNILAFAALVSVVLCSILVSILGPSGGAATVLFVEGIITALVVLRCRHILAESRLVRA